jgi:rhamnulokinase
VRLYQATGIAAQPINTVFQLMAERDLDRARHVVLVPDLITYWLSGQLGTEPTNASATGVLDTRVMKWADRAADRLAVPYQMFPPLRAAGEVAGLAVGAGDMRPGGQDGGDRTGRLVHVNHLSAELGDPGAQAGRAR